MSYAYQIVDARYAKGKKIIKPLDSKHGMKGRSSFLAEAVGGKWVHRSGGYTVSLKAAENFEKLFRAGFEAHVMCFTGEKPELYNKKLNIESTTLAHAFKMVKL